MSVSSLNILYHMFIKDPVHTSPEKKTGDFTAENA